MIKWHLRQVMAEKGIWTGQELLNALEKSRNYNFTYCSHAVNKART